MKDLKVLAEGLANLTVREIDAINKELASKGSSVVIDFVVSASLMSSGAGIDEAVPIGDDDNKKPSNGDDKLPPIGGGMPGIPYPVKDKE